MLAIEHFNIDLNSTTIALTRETNGGILLGAKIYDLEKYSDKVALRKKIKKQPEDFSVFLPHDGASRSIRREAINHPLCRNVFYLEEGTLSHLTYPYRLSNDAKKICKIPILGRKLEKFLRKPYFSAPNKNFVRLTTGAFPTEKRNSIITLSNSESITKYYKPRIKKSAFILLISQSVQFENFYAACGDFFRSETKKAVYVKMHPDLYKEKLKNKRGKIVEFFNSVGAEILDSGTIVEAEMLLRRHHVISSTNSSLAYYAHYFGSEYTMIYR